MKIGGVWKGLYTQSILPAFYSLPNIAPRNIVFLFLSFFVHLLFYASFLFSSLISIFLCRPLSQCVDLMWSDCVGGRPSLTVPAPEDCALLFREAGGGHSR